MMMFHRHPGFPSPRARAAHIAAHLCMAVVMGAALLLSLGYAVMLLWNGIMPALLSVSHISYWHGVGLLLLARILVGGFHHRGRHGHGGHGRLAHGSARHQYEDWWRDVGEQSFRDFASKRNPEET